METETARPVIHSWGNRLDVKCCSCTFSHAAPQQFSHRLRKAWSDLSVAFYPFAQLYCISCMCNIKIKRLVPRELTHRAEICILNAMHVGLDKNIIKFKLK